MNFYDITQYPAISPQATQMLREVGKAPFSIHKRFEKGATKHFKYLYEGNREQEDAGTEIALAGYADKIGTGYGFNLVLSQKGADLSRYLSS